MLGYIKMMMTTMMTIIALLLIIGLPRYNAFYGRGTGPLLLDDLICRNTEQRLIDCAHGGIGNTDFCRGHADDAGLDCRESKTTNITVHVNVCVCV